MEHYYTQNPESDSNPHRIVVSARGVQKQLMVDKGVFSTKGLDFGTRTLVETVQLPERGQFVDLGCGYGAVTAILAEVYPASRWIAVDINARAVQLAKQNLGSYGERVRVVQSDGMASVQSLDSVDGVLLNPPIRAGKAVVYNLFRQAHLSLMAGRSLWVVIHKKHGAKSAEVHLQTLFSAVVLRERDGGYHVFECVR